MDFFVREFDESIEVPQITLLQQWIEQHRTKGGGQRQGQARVHSVPQPAVHRLNQRDVGFRDGFKQPVFFEKLFVLGMSDERQVCVKDESEVALHVVGSRLARMNAKPGRYQIPSLPSTGGEAENWCA